VLSQFSLKNY